MVFVLGKTVGSLVVSCFNAKMWPCRACMRASACLCVCMCDTQNSMTTDTSCFGEKHDTVSHFRIYVCVF